MREIVSFLETTLCGLEEEKVVRERLDDFNKIRFKMSISSRVNSNKCWKYKTLSLLSTHWVDSTVDFKTFHICKNTLWHQRTDDISKMKLNRKFMYFQCTQPSGLTISEYSLAKWQIPCAKQIDSQRWRRSVAVTSTSAHWIHIPTWAKFWD